MQEDFIKVINLHVRNNMKGRKHIRNEPELGYCYRDISSKVGIYSIGKSESGGTGDTPAPHTEVQVMEGSNPW